MVTLLWAMKFALLGFVSTAGAYLIGFVLVAGSVVTYRHYHQCCWKTELSFELEWHQYALLWPLFLAQIIVLTPKAIRRYIKHWRHRCQDFWTGLTSS